jgi:hypothetical protein
MSEGLMICRETSNVYSLSAIDIPSIASAMRVMNSELSSASLALNRMQTASTNLQEAIRNASLLTSRHEIADSFQISNQIFSVAMSEIQENMTLLQEKLIKNSVTTETLSTPDDIVVAIHVAVNGPIINYRLAEMALHRFKSFWEIVIVGHNQENKIRFPEAVWTDNFMGNITKLFKLSENTEIFNFIRLINILTLEDSLGCSAGLFEALSLVLLQQIALPVSENVHRNWAYLISKNRLLNIDHGIARLVNSFLYSSRKQRISETLGIIGNSTSEELSPKVNSLLIILIHINFCTYFDICCQQFNPFLAHFFRSLHY